MISILNVLSIFLLFGTRANAPLTSSNRLLQQSRRELFGWDWFINAGNDIGDWIIGAGEDIADVGEDAIDVVVDAGESVADWTVGAAEDVGEWTVGAANDVADVTVEAATDVFDWTVQAADDVADFAEDAYNEVADFTEETVNEAADWVVNAADDIATWAKDQVECVVNTFKAATDECVLGAMKEAADACWISRDKECRFEIAKKDNGEPCVGFEATYTKGEVKTYVDAQIATEEIQANAFVQATAIAAATVSTNAEFGITLTDEPQVDFTFSPPRLVLDSEVSFEIEAGFSVEFEKRIELSPKKQVYYKIFMLGAIPILVEGTAQAVAIGTAAGSADASAHVTYTIDGWLDFGSDLEVSLNLKTGVVSTTEFDATMVRSFEDNWSWNVEGEVDLSLNANIGIEVLFTVNKLVTFTIFPTIGGSIELESSFGTGACEAQSNSFSSFIAVSGEMGFKKSLEISVGLEESEVRRRRLAGSSSINLFDAISDTCTSLEQNLNCGILGGCDDVVDLVQDLLWDGEIPIPGDLSFDILSLESSPLQATIPDECVVFNGAGAKTVSLTENLDTAPCRGQFEMMGQAFAGQHCSTTCPSHCMERFHIQEDGSRQKQCGPLCESSDADKHWKVTIHSEHAGGSTFTSDWYGPATTQFRVKQATDADRIRFVSSTWNAGSWTTHKCGSGFSFCWDRYGAKAYYIETSNGDCVMPLNCHNAGYNGLTAKQVETWLISARSVHAGGQQFESVYEGSKTSQFKFAQLTAAEYGQMSSHRKCGDVFRFCKDRFDLYAWYVRSSNGDCVMPLNCHFADYSHLTAFRHT